MSFFTFKTQRVSLTAGSIAPVIPPVVANTVKIGNATADDLKVYSTSGDETTYFVVSAGYAEIVSLSQWRFDNTVPAFYLKSAVDGTAVLTWT